MTDHILVTCTNPACGRRLKAPVAHAGKRARCSCGHVLLVPAPQIEPEPDDEPVMFLPSRSRSPERVPLLQNPVAWTIAGTSVALLLAGVAVWVAVGRSDPPQLQSTAEKSADPVASPPKPLERDRLDGEWTGTTAGDFWVAGVSFDKNEFPCAGAVRMGTNGISITTPVQWTKSGDEIIGTDNRRPPTIGPVLARVRLANGTIGGEAKAGEGALFIPSEWKKFSGFKRTGPPIAMEKPVTPPTKKPEEPAPTPMPKKEPVLPKKEEPPPPPKKKEPPPSTVEGKPDLILSNAILDRIEKSKRRIHPFYATKPGGKMEVKKGKDVGWDEAVVGWHSGIGWARSSTFAGLDDGTVFVNIGPHPVTAGDLEIEKGECVVLRKGRLVRADLKELESPEKK